MGECPEAGESGFTGDLFGTVVSGGGTGGEGTGGDEFLLVFDCEGFEGRKDLFVHWGTWADTVFDEDLVDDGGGGGGGEHFGGGAFAVDGFLAVDNDFP